MRARVSATVMQEDGTERTFEHRGLFAPLADRVAFERRFKTSAMVLSRLSEAFYDEDDPEVQAGRAKKGQLRPEADAAGIREEFVTFLVWRVLQRKAAAGEQVGTFDDFIEGVADIEIEDLEGAEEADPELDPTAPSPADVS